MQINKLIEEIKAAFSEIRYPGDDNIALNKRNLEYESLKDFLGLDWRDININFIFPKHVDSLCYMTPQAFSYFVPGYMLASIENYEWIDTVPDNLVSYFTFPSQRDIQGLNSFIKQACIQDNVPITEITFDDDVSIFYGRMKYFSQRQKQEIYKFLQFLIQEHGDDFPNNEPQLAIDRYWTIFQEKI